MTAFAALALYPLLAITNTVAITALRLGRRLGTGLLLLSMTLSLWVACLVALEHPESAAFAERYLPLGIMLAGPGVHAAADLIPVRKRYLYLAYGYGVAVALLGVVMPRAYYQPGFAGPGTLFWPVAVLSSIGVIWSGVWMLRAALEARGLMRRRRLALAVGSVFAALGSGAATAGYIFGVSSLAWAAPPLLIAILLVAYAILSGQVGRRELVAQDIAYSVMTAVLGAIGITTYVYMFPYLAPGQTLFWLLFISFVAALPLDQLRTLGVEAMGRKLFKNPIGLTDLADQITATKARADHAEGLAEIGTMASAVAHELRNPLGIIKAQAALLERRGADAKSVARLREQVDRASHFIDDLLHYSRPRPLSMETVALRERVGAAIHSVRELHAKNSPNIQFVAGAGDEEELEADPNAILDAHVTVLENAVAAGSTEITVEILPTADAIEVRITDNGPGVPRELATTLFEPFITGRGRDTQFPGTGLGLAITKRWLERHGGEIRHETPPEGGACFVLRWPRQVAEHG
jgi:signal transduction histidine kinase